MASVRTINFGLDNFAKARAHKYANKVKRNPKIAVCLACLNLQEHGWVVKYSYK